MTKKFLLVVMTMCVMTLAVMAASIDGKWTSEMAGRNGGAPRVTTYVFKADGDKLSGSMTMPGFGGGDPIVGKIDAGKIEGNKVSFKVTLDFNGNSRRRNIRARLRAIR